MKNYLQNKKAWYFLAGLAIGTIGFKMLKSKTAKRFYTNVIAHVMKFKSDVEASFEKMKEDAQDICYESKELCEKKESAQD